MWTENSRRKRIKTSIFLEYYLCGEFIERSGSMQISCSGLFTCMVTENLSISIVCSDLFYCYCTACKTTKNKGTELVRRMYSIKFNLPFFVGRIKLLLSIIKFIFCISFAFVKWKYIANKVFQIVFVSVISS